MFLTPGEYDRQFWHGGGSNWMNQFRNFYNSNTSGFYNWAVGTGNLEKLPTGQYKSNGSGGFVRSSINFIWNQLGGDEIKLEGDVSKLDPDRIYKFFEGAWEVANGSGSIEISNVFEATLYAFYGYNELVLDETGIEKVKNDPWAVKIDKKLVDMARNDPKFGKEEFSFRFKELYRFGGDRAPGDMKEQLKGFWKEEYRATWDVASKELTWLLRHAHVDGWVKVGENGSITIQHNLRDVLDLRRGAQSRGYYDEVVDKLGYIWHDLMGASEADVIANWRTKY